MNNIVILVTTVGGMTSPDILKAYKNIKQCKIKIIGIDPFELAVGREFVDIFEKCPCSSVDELAFIDFVKNLVTKYNIDAIIPCGNEDNLALSKHKKNISCKIMVGDYEDLIMAYDKGKVYNKLRDNISSCAPKYYIVNNYNDFLKAANYLGYPDKKIVIKPRFGRGGRGVYVLSSKSNLKDIFASKPTNEYDLESFAKILKQEDIFEDIIVMEYLTKPYYSVYSLCKNGNNIFSINHLREWGNASQTFRGRVYYDEKIENIASNIIKYFNLSYTNNMEFATSEEGNIVLFDLNPRIGASSGIDKDIGINFPYESLKILFNQNITINKEKFKKEKIFVRYFDQVWIN